MTNLEIALAVIAGCMAIVTAFLLRWAAETRERLARGVVLFLFVMMTSMAGAAVGYFSNPSSPSLLESFGIAGGIMLAAAAVLFVVFLGEAKRRAAVRTEESRAEPSPASLSWPFLAAVAALVLLGEFLMGWAFQLATAPGSVPTGGDLTGFASAVLNSPWFVFTMAGEMALTTYLLRARLGSAFVPLLALQSLIMFLSPTTLPSENFGSVSVNAGNGAIGVLSFTWVNLSVVLGSALMIVLIIFVMEHIYRHPELPRAFGTYLALLVGVYGVMMAGLFVWLNYGDARLFGLSIVLEMVLYLGAILIPERFEGEDRFSWQLNANWAAGLLAGIFVAEIFMGAVLDVVLEPQVFAGNWPALPLSGPASVVLTNLFWNGFGFFAESAASTWFLLMMGAEMGMLVVFKFRESHDFENKLRLVLMMVCYFSFAIFWSSWYYGQIVSDPTYGGAGNTLNVPVLGWSMGIGSAQIAPPLFLVITLTYAITGVLCFLFGRRVICSVFCTAPLMYQGTAIDSMKSFNRHSRIARKYLGNKLSNVYMATTGLVMGSLFVATVLSYTNYLGATNVLVGPFQWDPTVFLFATYFSVLWYVMFVAIPYVGDYNCVTMGWCYTGTVAQAFQKLGPYKLKVRSKEVCRACTTVDCGRACPVGLVDMPGFFRTKGEYRSSKCCGVGNCVGACPYGNLYIYDIRHWVAEHLGRDPGDMFGTRLKMLPSSHRSPPAPSPPVLVEEAGSAP
jgi:polyferredoxin